MFLRRAAAGSASLLAAQRSAATATATLHSPRCFAAKATATSAGSAATESPPPPPPSSADLAAEPFRTNAFSPDAQRTEHTSKFYRLQPELSRQLFAQGGLPKTYATQLKTFGEACLMVRRPALELMHHIRSGDLRQAATRYVLYGRDGAGKSLTLAHLLHYGREQGFVLVHVPWVPNWFKKPKEKANSTTREGCIDLPIDAAAWLIHFKGQNAQLLPQLDLRCSRDYVWSKRETTPKGATLLELIEHGIARIKFAPDTVAVLIEELKQQSTAGRCKTMVAIDGYNAFFYPRTLIRNDQKQPVEPSQVTLTRPFVQATQADWSNGVCVLVVDRLALDAERQASVLPRYLLGEEGFEHLDPMVPVRVDDYTEQEFRSCVDYYLNRRWIQRGGDAQEQERLVKELQFLSGNNPYALMQMCRSL